MRRLTPIALLASVSILMGCSSEGTTISKTKNAALTSSTTAALPTTSTSLAAATSTTPAQTANCLLRMNGAILTACASFKQISYSFWSDSNVVPLSQVRTESIRGAGTNTFDFANTFDFKQQRALPNITTRIQVALTMTDGRELPPTYISYRTVGAFTATGSTSTQQIPTTTTIQPQCLVRINQNGTVSLCGIVSEYSYRYWSDTQPFEGKGVRPYMPVSFFSLVAPTSSLSKITRVQFTLKFYSGQTATGFVPYRTTRNFANLPISR